VVRVPGYRCRDLGFDFRRYHIFWEVLGLERGPLSLVSKIEELLGRNSSGSGLENREYGRGDPLRWPRDTLYPQKLALNSPISGGRLRTKATEFVVLFFVVCLTKSGINIILCGNLFGLKDWNISKYLSSQLPREFRFRNKFPVTSAVHVG
jgi:hypothetical protein